MEIKKAFEQMKKELKKETGIHGGFTMNVKQIKNRTATYLFGLSWSYESELEYRRKMNEKVQGYDTWTKEAKARTNEDFLEHKELIEGNIAYFGTRENEFDIVTNIIVNSKAFENFEKAVGGKVEWYKEEVNGAYYIRFNY